MENKVNLPGSVDQSVTNDLVFGTGDNNEGFLDYSIYNYIGESEAEVYSCLIDDNCFRFEHEEWIN